MIASNRPGRHHRLGVLLIAMTAAGCHTTGSTPSAAEQSEPPPRSVEERRAIIEQTRSHVPAARASQAEKAEARGEVPRVIIDVVTDDLVRRALIRRENVTVKSASEQTWPNGALGCARPGDMYTQALIEGYRVVLSTAGNDYHYHSDRGGRFILCQEGAALQPVKKQQTAPDK